MVTKTFLVLSVSALFFMAGCSKDNSGPAPLPATYYYPPLSGDTWDKTEPGSLGWDANKLTDLLKYLDSNNTGAFIILYKGRIVNETYWRGYNASTSAKIFSATKSIGAFLTGLAQEQGKLDIDKPVSDYLGAGWSNASLSQKTKITVKHLITMTSGLKDDLALSYDTTPGTRWFYNTTAYHKLYEVLAAAYGKSNALYTNEQLWSKIGMQNSFWDTETNGGPTMSCSARDMARFGSMILSKGSWSGTPIMTNAAYFSAMTASSQTLNPSYGYLWWLNGQSSFILPGNTGTSFSGELMPLAPADLIAALGYGDKKIYVVPSKELVVIRHGMPSNAPISYALSNFDNEIWKRLALVIK
jgi:CubicO group peptidase (beta-lactamase class C family)